MDGEKCRMIPIVIIKKQTAESNTTKAFRKLKIFFEILFGNINSSPLSLFQFFNTSLIKKGRG
jgi:hypothetical protein